MPPDLPRIGALRRHLMHDLTIMRHAIRSAEMLADADSLDADGAGHGRPARKVALSLTAPNTPPCILIICKAAA